MTFSFSLKNLTRFKIFGFDLRVNFSPGLLINFFAKCKIFSTSNLNQITSIASLKIKDWWQSCHFMYFRFSSNSTFFYTKGGISTPLSNSLFFYFRLVPSSWFSLQLKWQKNSWHLDVNFLLFAQVVISFSEFFSCSGRHCLNP